MMMRIKDLAWLLPVACVLMSGCDRARAISEIEAQERSTRLYTNAMDDYRAGRLEAAIKGFERVVLDEPKSYSAHFQLATLLHDVRKDYIGAIAHYRAYLALRPASDKATVAVDRMKLCETLLAADIVKKASVGPDVLKNENMKLAAERLSRFRKEYPDHALVPQAQAWLVQIYEIMNDGMAAERETWLLAEQHPDSEYAVDAMFRLASRYAEEGAREKAAAALRKLALDNRFPRIQARAVYELAFQAYRNGEKAEARRYLAELYEKFPDSPVLADGYYLNGDLLRSDSDFKSAIPFYRKVTEMRPVSRLTASAYGSIGDCLLAIASQDPASSENELLSAVQMYKTLREQPGCPPAFEAMALYRTGRCLELLNQRTRAAEEYRKVLYQFPAAEARRRPSETIWCVRAAEALIDMAGKYPIRTTLRHARFALHWLADAGLIPVQEAAERFEKLKNNKFNP